MKYLKAKKSSKEERKKQVLFALIEHFLKDGVPVGSNTLRNSGFSTLSPATIRNYFASLEEEGLLTQQHASSGRIPTNSAYRLYANASLESSEVSSQDEAVIQRLKKEGSKEIATYLQNSAEVLSSMTNYAVFLSAPRFDHDFIATLKLIPIDYYRFLCVIITDFGVIQTELLHTERRLSSFAVKRIEEYFHWRLTKRDKPENITEEEEQLGQKFYNELMVRYIVGYSNFTDEEIYRTGFSKLLTYPDFHDATVLANSLALFENAHSMRLLLRECSSQNMLRFWIGSDLSPYSSAIPNCSVLAVPYKINTQTVGAVGILGPTRMPYKALFGILRSFSDTVSEVLTHNVYKFKITYRQPQTGSPYLQKEEHRLIGQSRLMLLEDKTNREELP